MSRHLLFAALLLLCATGAWAQAPGSLDETFAGDGHVAPDLSAQNRDDESATEVLIQSDGKRVVVVDRYPWIQLIRFNPDGTYDDTFGQGGFSQAAPIRHFGGPLSNAAIQSDGKIVVAGETEWNSTTMTDFGIARWNTDGALDASFGNQGMVTLDYGYWDEGQMVRVQPGDGRLVVAGEVRINNDPFIALARLNTDGSLDATFGVNGKYVNVIGVELIDMGLMPDGKLMVLAEDYPNSMLVRFGANGILDTSFGTLGTKPLSLELNGHDAGFDCLAIQPDGRLLVGGSIYNGVNGDMFVARLSAEGSVDPTFHGDGMQTTHIGGSEYVRALAVQPDGKIVAAGYVFYPALPTVFALARYTASGDLDGSFGVQGTQITSFSGYEGASGTAVALHGDGDITVAGTAFNNFTSDVAIATYDVQGAMDQDGYAVQRILAFEADNGYTSFRASVVQPDGKLVTAGYVWNGRDYDMVVARFNLDGALDPSFGTNGSTRVDFAGVQQGSGDEAGSALAIQPDGRIVVTGSFFGFTVGGALPVARLDAAGALDASFGTGGLVLLDLPGIFEEGNAALIQPDGQIVIAGSVDQADFDFMLCRLNPDGTLDGTFGTSGVVTSDWGYQDIAFGLILQPDGKLVATGNTSLKDSFLGFDFNTARYLPDGSLDAGFGTAGRVTTDFGGGFDFADAIAHQADGGLVVAGSAPVSNDMQFGLARYGPTGSPDPGFGSAGTATTGMLGYDVANAVALQDDGAILTGGYTDGQAGNSGPVDIGLTRHSTAGVLDGTFGSGGKVVSDLGGQEFGMAMSLYERRIHVAGMQRMFNAFTATDKYLGLVATYLTGPPTAEELIGDEIPKIDDLPGVHHGTKEALKSKLNAALAALAVGDTTSACNNLQALMNQLKALTGKKLTADQGSELLTDVLAIMTTLGCDTQDAMVARETPMAPQSPVGQPTSFALEANAPNPFMGATRIGYQLPVPSKVSLRIYNVQGQVVATLVDGIESPGWKSVRWEASRMPAGVYFCRLTAGAFTAERKLLLVR